MIRIGDHADGSEESQIGDPDSRVLSDSHCHLTMTQDPPAVLDRAMAAGVRLFLVPGTTLADCEQAVALAQSNERVFAAVGVHPHEASHFDLSRDGPELERLARQPRVVAIGEIGLDFYYDHSPRMRQIEVLEWMLDLARRLGLPVILHNRESSAEMLKILSRQARRERPGVFHSFTESAEYGGKALDLGYRISFSGMLTFRSAENIRRAAVALPLDSMLLETDTPFLAPEPHRGNPNEPAFLVQTAMRLAELKRSDLETVAAVTTANFESLFVLD